MTDLAECERAVEDALRIGYRLIDTTASYKLDGLDISANVYTPASYDPKKAYPAVVVAHPNGGVKGQVPPR